MESRDKNFEMPGIGSEEDFLIPELEELIGNIPCKPWSEYEVNVLNHYYGKVPTKRIAELLGRSYTAAQSKAHRLGLNHAI